MIYKKYIPRPSPDLGTVNIFDFCSVSETIAELIRSFRFLIPKLDLCQAQLVKSLQFTRFGDAVMIDVLPQSQAAKNTILCGYLAIAVAAILRFIIFRQCNETVTLIPWYGIRLRREVAEHFRAIVNQSIIVPV